MYILYIFMIPILSCNCHQQTLVKPKQYTLAS